MSIHSRRTPKSAGRRQRRVLYVVGSEGRQRALVSGALRALPDVLREVRQLSDVPLRATCECAAVVIIVDSGALDACSANALSEFRAHDAATVILLAMRTGSRTAHQLAALARAGLDALYNLDGVESLESLRRAAARHLANALPWNLVRAVVPRGVGEAVGILSHCLRHGDRPHDIDHIARWLQWDRKTIYRKLKDQRLRPIGDLINLGRLLHAVMRLDRSAAPITTIARGLHYDTPSTLRRLIKREAGCTPTELRRRGAVNTAVAVLRTRLV